MAKETFLTTANRVLDNHIYLDKGAKTVCVSTVLNFLNISPDKYNFTSTYKDVCHYEKVMYYKGNYGLRNYTKKLSDKYLSISKMKKEIKKISGNSQEFFLVHGFNKSSAHLLLINGKGETVIDTAPQCRYKVLSVKRVVARRNHTPVKDFKWD